jgi:FkbM family methyltransferase
MFNLLKKLKRKAPSKCNFGNAITKYIIPQSIRKINLIDVGANRGYFYDEVIFLFKDCEINSTLIEPIPECYDLLKSKYKNNKNVSVLNYALNDEITKKTFFINEFDETSSLLEIKKDIPELRNVKTNLKTIIEIETMTLDEVMKKNEEIVDILKIDVQGAEHKVLEGAANALKKVKYIWIEVSFKSLYEGSSTFNEIYDKLTSLNFILLEIVEGHRSPNNELLQANCLFKNHSI